MRTQRMPPAKLPLGSILGGPQRAAAEWKAEISRQGDQKYDVLFCMVLTLAFAVIDSISDWLYISSPVCSPYHQHGLLPLLPFRRSKMPANGSPVRSSNPRPGVCFSFSGLLTCSPRQVSRKVVSNRFCKTFSLGCRKGHCLYFFSSGFLPTMKYLEQTN